MSAVSMPMPITRIRTRTMRFGPVLGARFSCSRRSFSICRICSTMSCFRREVALQLRERIGWDRLALGRAQMFQALRRLLELGIEAADAEPRQGRLDAVDDGGLLANEGLALAVRALGILLRDGRDRAHSCSGSARRGASRGRRV